MTIVAELTPETAGWTYSGLTVLALADGEEHRLHLTADEAVLLPLSGSADVAVVAPGGRVEARLAGRTSPFAAASDFAYLPLGSEAVVRAAGGPLRLAVATARAERSHPVRIVRASGVSTELRGAGVCTRAVRNLTLGSDIERDRLLVCEVVTPGGNWSSYPPHKHDEHTDDERELEEIYYYEIAPGPTGGDGVGYHRTYGTAQRPIEVLTEVRTGDTIAVPHGYHGPCIASPGQDMYYLNVMAGPVTDGQWLATDDPALAWVRGSWSGLAPDPRLADDPRLAPPTPPREDQ